MYRLCGPPAAVARVRSGARHRRILLEAIVASRRLSLEATDAAPRKWRHFTCAHLELVS